MSDDTIGMKIMSAVVATAGLAIMAFAVWLTVRIVNHRERWAKRTAAILLASLIAYPLSYGPAMGLVYHMGQRRWLWDRDVIRQSLFLAYWPIRRLHADGQPPIRDVIEWYTRRWK